MGSFGGDQVDDGALVFLHLGCLLRDISSLFYQQLNTSPLHVDCRHVQGSVTGGGAEATEQLLVMLQQALNNVFLPLGSSQMDGGQVFVV